MKNFLSKTLPLAVVALLATSTAVAQGRYNRNRQQKMEQGHAIKGNQMVPAYNAPARYDVQGSWDFYFQGDFVYMQAIEENLTYAVSTSDAQANTENPPLNGKIFSPDFEWHPGFRIGFGGYTEHDDWGVFVEWMHYVSKQNTTTTAQGSGSLYMTQSVNVNDTDQSALKASNTYSLAFNCIDLNLDRPYYVGKKLTFDTFVGLRGAWLNQRYNTQYDTVVEGGTTQRGTTQTLSSYDNWAIGPRVGVNTKWLIGSGFRLFGNAAGSLLFTDWDVSKTITNSSQAGSLTGRNVNQDLMSVKDDGVYGIRPNMNLALGFAWGTYFADSTWHVDMELGYEFNQWWGQNQNLVSADGQERGTFLTGGDLAIHGATFTLRFDL